MSEYFLIDFLIDWPAAGAENFADVWLRNMEFVNIL